VARDEPVVVVGQPIASQADMALFTAFSNLEAPIAPRL